MRFTGAVALENYGVLVGSLHGHERDRPDNQGRWYHVKLRIAAPLGRYECAVDVDSHESATGVQWKVLTVAREAVAPLPDLEPGYHDLDSTATSGAWDLIRHPALVAQPFTSGSFLEATIGLETILARGRRTCILGQPFDPGDLGMHNIHQNQGDPWGSPWWPQNAIWQDGGTMTERPDGTLDVFVSKFTSQAAETDDEGHPVADVSAAPADG